MDVHPMGQVRTIACVYWFKLREGGEYYEILKLKKAPEAQGLSAAYDPEVPIMRLPEIYYIACEAQIGKDNDLALSYLNAVRETVIW